MFEPQIVVLASGQLGTIFSQAFSVTSPPKITLSIPPGITKNTKWKPNIRFVETLSSSDSMFNSSTIVIYLFTVSSKKEYDTGEKPKLLELQARLGKLGVSIIPIYAHDTRLKTKWGFSASSMLSHVQTDAATACVSRIKSSGQPKKDDLRKVWPMITSEVARDVKERVEQSTTSVSNLGTAEVFKHYLRLITIYESIECFKESFGVVTAADARVRSRGDLFKSFGSIHALADGLDLDKTLHERDGCIMTSELHRYPVWRVFMRHGVLALRRQNLVDESMRYTFKWIREVSRFVEKNVSRKCYYFWFAKTLRDAIMVCKAEIEATRRLRKVGEFGMLWYVRTLPTLRLVLFESGETWQHEGDIDPLAAAPSVTPAEADEFPEIYKLVKSGDAFKEEMNRWLAMCLTISKTLKHTRMVAYISKQLFADDPDEEQTRESVALTYAMRNYAHAHTHMLKGLSGWSVSSQLTVCCGILTDRQSTIQGRACALISELVQSPTFEGANVAVPIPISIRVISEQEQTEGESTSLKIIFRCYFSGTIKCPRLSLSFVPDVSAMFSVASFDLTDGAVAEVSGEFPSGGWFRASHVFISSGTGQIKIPIPSDEIVRVEARPPAISLKVEMPSFFLPNCWQMALVKLTAIRPLDSLTMTVSGVTSRPAALRGPNKVMTEPHTGFEFGAIDVGQHTMYLPVKPSQAGVLKIKAQTGDSSVVREETFDVSNFLNIEVLYRPGTKVAQISLSLLSAEAVVLRDVKYFRADEEEIACESIGIPRALEISPCSVLGLLQDDPVTANVFIQQKDLAPFSLNLDVTHRKAMEAEKTEPMAPLTVLIPEGFNM